MKVRTVNELNDTLDADLAWRKKDLTVLRFHFRRAKVPAEQDCFIRASTTLIYAHWEGFIKNAAQAFLRFVALRRITHEKLHPNIAALCFRTAFNDIGNSSRSAIYGDKVKYIISNMTCQSNVPWETAISTQSNLNYEVLTDILYATALGTSLFDTRQKLIDEKLLARRNKIAHGEYDLPSPTDTDLLFSEIPSMLSEFKEALILAASTGAYHLP